MASTDGADRHLPHEGAHNEFVFHESAPSVSVDFPWLVLAVGAVWFEQYDSLLSACRAAYREYVRIQIYEVEAIFYWLPGANLRLDHHYYLEGMLRE
jgi:hypothetical protein